jgi:geranylgeranyl reductase family protein
MGRHFDLAVVGGGPCGLYASLLASRSGIDTVLFEEHESIGSPQHCAGHISLKGIRELGLRLPQRLFRGTYRGAILHSPSGRALTLDAGEEVSASIDRRGFEIYLSDLSQSAGTTLALGERVRGARPAGGSLEIISRLRSAKCKILLDAEGYPPRLLGEMGAWSPGDYSALIGIGAEVEEAYAAREGFVELYFGRGIAPGFFAWLIPLKGGGARIGLATEGGNPRQLLDRFMRDRLIRSGRLPDRPRMVEVLSPHPIPIWRGGYKTYGNGLLVVGDAASQVKPTTGGGLFMGMRCSSMAIETAKLALSAGDWGSDALSRYERLWKGAFSLELRLMGAIRRAIFGLGDREMDALFEGLSNSALLEMANSNPEMDFQGRALLRALLNPIGFISIARALSRPFLGALFKRGSNRRVDSH